MGLDVEDSDVSKRYKEVCADLNLDKHSADEAWQSFQRIGRNYTLEGDKLHWLACALYVSCRKGVTPTIGGRGGIEGNCVSLTRLLRSCRLSLVQFFNKMKKWSDMANLPHEMRNKIDHHERNFNVSTVIFKKFKPIFLNIFKDPSLSPTKPTKNRKQSRRQFVTSSEVFSFCWTLYIHVKAHFPQISDDLVNSYHLLLCCVDLCYSNAIVADNAKDLINPEFDALPEGFSSPDFKLPDKIGCIIQALCKKYDGMFVEAKGIKEHWWNSKVKRMIEREELKARKCEAGQPVQLLGLFDSSNFPFNLRSINKEYDRHVLNIGDFDERIFLCDNAHEELGTPQTSGDDVTIKTIMNQGLKKHMESTTSLMPSTPLSNRHYLKDKESALTATPVSSATHTVGQLHSLLLDRKPEPSEGLLTLFEECSSNPQQFIGTLITEIGQLFVTAYCQPATPEEEAEMPMLVQPGDFAKKRLELGVTLYYRCLENVMNREKKRLINSDKSKEALSNLLLQETMHVSLFACAMEIVLFSYNSQRTFPWIIDILSTFRNLNFQPFHFYKVIELIIRDEDGLSRSVVKHLNSLEEKILGSLAWKANSALWEAIKTQGTIPSCQDVALPNAPASEQKTILASPMAAVKRIARSDAFASPIGNSSMSERFNSPLGSGAKRKLFDQPGSDKPGSIITISLPAHTANGEVRYVSIPALAVMSQNEASPNKMEPPRPKAGPLGLFFRKVYNLSWLRMRDLCDRLNIADDDLKRKIWTCFELSLRNHTDLMKDRHLDQLLMCAIYAMCKVARHEISFQEIMKCYRLQPQSTSHIYRSVLLNNRGRRNSASSENSRNSGSASPIGSQEERERIRSSSTLPIPHPSSQPPTPTRLAGTGSQFDFGEERGDLIMFYNQVYVPEMKSYIMKFTTENSSPMLSPLPRLAQNPVSPCRRISQQHKLFISPMKAPNFPPSPKRPLSYSFLRSPAKDLNKINLMMKGLSDKKPVSKRILQDDASENENSPVKRHCSDPVLFRSKIQNIFTERQGSVASEDSSSNFVENGNDSSGGF